MLNHQSVQGWLKCLTCGFCRKEECVAISKYELLKDRDREYASEYTKEISENLDKLLIPLNKIRSAYGKAMIVSSGWRPSAINAKTPGAAAKSNHLLGLAVDIVDTDGKLWEWVMQNLQLMKDLGVYLEDKRWTKGWVHFQIVAPKSKKRIFVPSTAPASAPEAWNGQYDSKFDN